MISKTDIENLAILARLKLSSEEIAGLEKDMTEILEYVAQVNDAHSGAEVTMPVVRTILRDDTPRTENDLLAGKRTALLSTLPKREGEYAVVRKIIQKDE
jgi:aspartyl/glutamyl-tRNA(Asn/Gln) amidotransferase C subunit